MLWICFLPSADDTLESGYRKRGLPWNAMQERSRELWVVCSAEFSVDEPIAN
jgi:hypothetical protein